VVVASISDLLRNVVERPDQRVRVPHNHDSLLLVVVSGHVVEVDSIVNELRYDIANEEQFHTCPKHAHDISHS
jgi:hypothetical protein